MKLLIVTHDYPPALSPRAFRWGAIVEELVSRGHDLTVVCGWAPDASRQQARQNPGRLRVQRLGGTFCQFRHWLGGGPPHVEADRAPVTGQRAASRARLTALPIRRGVGRVGRAVWRAVYWPDAYCAFILPARRAARRLIIEDRPDALITVSYPFSCHLAGLWLKRRFPDLPWVADVGDPFAFCGFPNNGRLYHRRNVAAESSVLAAADRVAVTNPGAVEHYVANFAVSAGKLAVIPPLLSLAASDRQAAEETTGNGESGVHGPFYVTGTRPRATHNGQRPIRLVYCGQLYRAIRSPVPLLELLKRSVAGPPPAPELELHLYGGLGDCEDLIEPYRGLIGSRLFLRGFVSREEASRAMRGADLLVNIGNATPHQVPSKIVECIGYGKPILNLVTHPHDYTRQLLANHPAALTLDVRSGACEGHLRQLEQFLRRLPGDVPYSACAAVVQPFLPETIASSYLSLTAGAWDNSDSRRAPARLSRAG